MGWIRKQFRRIRRRVKKLLSTKFGRIIGGIGLSMAMGWAAGKLFEGAKTLFGGVQGASGAAGASTTAATTASTTAAKTGTETLMAGLQEGGKQALGQTTREGMVALSESARTTLANAGTTLDNISKATNNVEAFGKFQEIQQAADLTGVSQSTFTNNLTTAVENTVTDLGAMPNKLPNISEPITVELPNANDFRTGAMETVDASRTVADTIVAESPKTMLEAGERFVRNAWQDTKDYFQNEVLPDGPGELIGEGAKVAVGTAINNYLSDDGNNDYMGTGQVMNIQTQGSMPQNQYLSDISNQYQSAMNTSQMPNMNEVMNGAFYGNMSPQYIQNLNQQMYNTFMPLPA